MRQTLTLSIVAVFVVAAAVVPTAHDDGRE
jgi:hypothetical protein